MAGLRPAVWEVKATAAEAREDPAAKTIAEELDLTLPAAKLLADRGCKTPADAERFIKKKEEQTIMPVLLWNRQDLPIFAVMITIKTPACIPFPRSWDIRLSATGTDPLS